MMKGVGADGAVEELLTPFHRLPPLVFTFSFIIQKIPPAVIANVPTPNVANSHRRRRFSAMTDDNASSCTQSNASSYSTGDFLMLALSTKGPKDFYCAICGYSDM